MKDDTGQPMAGECHYGIPDGDDPVAESNARGKLTLGDVFPGRFLIGYERDEQFVTVNEDESVTPDQLTWDVS